MCILREDLHAFNALQCRVALLDTDKIYHPQIYRHIRANAMKLYKPVQ
jgi:hypothetical protein